MKLILSIAALLLITACSPMESPRDTNGSKPEDIMLKIYIHFSNNECDKARQYFSAEYIATIITGNKLSFTDFCQKYTSWQEKWLRVELVGNDYNKDLWSVRVIPDEGLGKKNRAGAVQEFYMIDGQWKIVFWNHYPKS